MLILLTLVTPRNDDIVKSIHRHCVHFACFALSPALVFAQTGNTTLGTNAGASLTTGDNNTLIGDTAGGKVASLSSNTFIGHYSGLIFSRGSSTYIGQSAGAANVTGTDNTFIGARAGLVNTATDNTFIGTDAGASNTTGFDNTFIGEEAGKNCIKGDDNVFIGDGAGNSNTNGADNTFIGSRAGYGGGVALTGDHNTAVGGSGSSIDIDFNGVMIERTFGPAGNDLATGFANTFFGAGAGKDNGEGVGNTFLGYGTGTNSEYADFNTFVGTQAGWSNNHTAYTNSANGNTYMGFGAGMTNREGISNTGFGAFADVNGTVRSYNTFIGAETSANNHHTVVIGYQALASGANSIAIGNTVAVSTANEVLIGNNATTSIGGPVNWTATSDGRLKTNVTQNVPGLDFINRLRPVTYEFDALRAHTFSGAQLPEFLKEAAAQKSKVRYTGFIAQEVERAAQAAGYNFSGVKVPADPSTQTYGLRYAEFVAPLTRAVQELSAKSRACASKIDAHKATIESQVTLIGSQAAALRRYTEMAKQLGQQIELLEARRPQTPSSR